jgi:hypothetical protein
MKAYAHIENGIVTNISRWDGVTPYDPGDGVTMVVADENARIGGTYDGSFHFVEPPAPEPTAEQKARQEKIDSAKVKLENLGLSIEEIKEAFGI